MKIALINKSDKTGGAAVAAMRLTNALLKNDTDCSMLVQEKLTDLNLKPIAILATHGHFDHSSSAPAMLNASTKKDI